MNYKIAPLILTPGYKSNSTSEVFISQPDANKESLAGKLFALIEIESKRADDLKIINFLINTLNHNYYQNEKMILREHLSNLKIEHIFESSLAKTNKKLAEFLQNEKIKLNQSLVNITVGVIYKDSLHFSNSGKNKALLICQTKAVNNQTKYKLIDITQQTNGAELKKQQTLIKLFSNVVSGSVPTGGFFIFTSETLPEYLSTKQIIDIITTLPPASAVEQLKNVLVKINAYVPFLSIIVKNTIGLETPEIEKKTTQLKADSSLANLNTTEETTEKLLTPSGLVGFKKWGISLSKLFNLTKFKSFQRDNRKGNFLLKDKIFSKRKPSWSLIKKVFGSLKITIFYLAGIFVYFYKITTDRKKIVEFPDTIKSKANNCLNSLKYRIFRLILWFKSLNKKNKILFAVSLICLIFFTQNLLWTNFKNRQAEKQKFFSDLIKTIDQKQNQIDANLLYSNEDNAKKLLEEVRGLLAQVPNDMDEQEEKYQQLIMKNQVQIEKISHVIKIESPVELANFKNLANGANPTNIIMLKGKIYAGDSGQKLIYNLDVGNNLITAIPKMSATKPQADINQLNYPAADNSNKIYYLNSNSVIELNVDTEEINNLNIDYTNSLLQIADMANFNNRLYMLDPKNNQIYRYNKAQNKLTNSTPWITEKIDLADSTSLDIDGNIYILKSNGKILKLLKGKSENFSLESVEPSLSQVTKLSVSPELEYLYILEPTNKRLVVFNKSGKFLNQYVCDQFTNLKDFFVDEIAKKIYFLNNSSVYAVEANHFKK